MDKEYISAVIVDDEAAARKELKYLLTSHPIVQVVGEADSIEDAVRVVTLSNPDVVFLDIDIAGESGFNLLSKISSDISIIFVTAYNKFAIRAFEVNALDYLTKPVSAKRLATSIERLSSPVVEEKGKAPSFQEDDEAFVALEGGAKFIKVSTILSLKACGNYSEVQTIDGKNYLTYKALSSWEEQLPADIFVRIHRSTIINLKAVKRLERLDSGEVALYVDKFEEPFIVSRRRVSFLKEKISNL